MVISTYSLLYTIRVYITTVFNTYSDRNKFVWFLLYRDVDDAK